MLQVGPNVGSGINRLVVQDLDCLSLRLLLEPLYPKKLPPLIYYTDNFYLRSQPLSNIKYWPSPSILVCGDLHHGHHPLITLHQYLNVERYDGILLLCNNSMLNTVRLMTTSPVRFLPPSFFRYPKVPKVLQPSPVLLHVGSIGKYHPDRRSIVEQLIARKNIPFLHATTSSTSEASDLYSKHALVLNIPLNNDLNHRIFECMGASTPQIILGSPEILGDREYLALRQDLLWVNSVQEIEDLAVYLLEPPHYRFKDIPVYDPPDWDIEDLIKCTVAPYCFHLSSLSRQDRK